MIDPDPNYIIEGKQAGSSSKSAGGISAPAPGPGIGTVKLTGARRKSLPKIKSDHLFGKLQPSEDSKSTSLANTILDEDSMSQESLVKSHKNDFGKNLLQNPFGMGEDPHECDMIYFGRNRRGTQYLRVCSDMSCPRFQHWTIVDSGGSGWTVERTPFGSDPLPEGLPERSCFVTSYGLCSKEQIIELAKHGLTPRIMDVVRPHLEVSEWYAGRFDCGSTYGLKVSLLDARKLMVNVYGERKKIEKGDTRWHMVTYTFRDYDPGVRYVLFHHAGQDSQFWDGHYGSKMAGGSVLARVPRTWFQRRTSRQSPKSLPDPSGNQN